MILGDAGFMLSAAPQLPTQNHEQRSAQEWDSTPRRHVPKFWLLVYAPMIFDADSLTSTAQEAALRWRAQAQDGAPGKGSRLGGPCDVVIIFRLGLA